MKNNNNIMIGVAGEYLSSGSAVEVSGYRWMYFGKLFNPLTWLKFKKVAVIKRINVNHVALVKVANSLRTIKNENS